MGGKTPGLGSKTPGLGSKTPGLGRKTPGWSILRERCSKTPSLALGGQDLRRGSFTANSNFGRNSSMVGMFQKNENGFQSQNDEEDGEISQEYRQILVEYVIGDDSRTGGTAAMGDFDDEVNCFDDEVKMMFIII
jgi:hypothetical protein